jgi:hypothetical protein
MRIPKIENYKGSNKIEVMNISDVGKVSRNILLLSEKEKIKFIKSIERLVRSSQEYRDYIQYLRQEIDMTKCTFFGNISNKETKGITIEIHHEPFTLFDITQTVLQKYLITGQELNYFTVAEEVMKIHYQGRVGLVPLSATVHQLVGEGKLFIPLQNVYGDFINFLEEYDEFISEDLKSILEVKLMMSKEIEEPDKSILEQKYIYLEIDGMSFPQPLEYK